jgi:hypothetical protein
VAFTALPHAQRQGCTLKAGALHVCYSPLDRLAIDRALELAKPSIAIIAVLPPAAKRLRLEIFMAFS